VANVQLEAAEKLGVERAAQGLEHVHRARRLALDCLQNVRRSVAALRAATLEELALDRALQRHCTEFPDSAGIPVQLSVISPAKRIASNPPKIEKQKRKECA
jgi:signal transduction histidine kinase